MRCSLTLRFGARAWRMGYTAFTLCRFGGIFIFPFSLSKMVAMCWGVDLKLLLKLDAFQRYFVGKINSLHFFIHEILKLSTFLNYDFRHEIEVTAHLIRVFIFLSPLGIKYLLEGYGEERTTTTTTKRKKKERGGDLKRKQKNKGKKKKSSNKNKQTKKSKTWNQTNQRSRSVLSPRYMW